MTRRRYADPPGPGEHTLPRRNCAQCGLSMPDVGFAVCFGCSFPGSGESSVGVYARVTKAERVRDAAR